MNSILHTLLKVVPFSLRSKIKYIPLLKQLQQYIVRRYLNGKSSTSTITAGPAKGLVFPFEFPQDKLIWTGTYELKFAQALASYIKPGYVCYDIGAYKGYYSGIMALKGAGEVFVFEPMPANIRKIKNLIKLNPDLKITLKEIAVADYSGDVEFKLMPEETMGKLSKSTFQAYEKEVEILKIPSYSIDDLIENGLREPDFIKIDVEGAEELVLEGAKNLLTRKKPILMIEVHSEEIGKRCNEMLKQIYSIIYVLETGGLPEDSTLSICHYVALA